MDARQGKGKQRATDDSLGKRIVDSARSLATETGRPSPGSTSLGSTLEMDGKPLPAQLRKTALEDASLHAETSGSSTNRRWAGDARAPTAIDSDFSSFARPAVLPSSHHGHASDRAAQYSARDYTAADLAPRPTDGADVLALLNGTLHASDDYEPSETPWTHSDSDLQGFEVDEDHSPYLLHLLRSPFGADARADLASEVDQSDGQAIVRYLEQTRYSDDVWLLPEPVMKLVLAASGAASEGRARDKAIARLGALARQLRLEGEEEGAFARAWHASR